MKGSKLFSLLKKMDKNEFLQLEKFVKSPFFNSNKGLSILYDCIKDGYPDFQSAKLTKENAAKLIFPNHTFSVQLRDKRVGNVMSDMYYLVLEFLGQMEFQTNKIERGKLKADGLRKKGLLAEHREELKNVEEALEEQPARSIHYYWNLFYLSNRKHISDSGVDYAVSKKYLENMMNYLDKLYVLGKLKIWSEMSSRQGILGEIYENALFLDEAKKIANIDLKADNTLFKMYYYIVQLIDTGEASYYWKLKNLFFENYELLGKESQFEVLLYLINFTVKRDIVADASFLAEGFELPKFGFTTGILHEEMPQTENAFQNMVLVGARLGQFDWIASFLETLGKNPDKGYSRDVITFAKIGFLYAKKEFSSARELILNHQFKREQDKIRVKSVLIKILYEEYCEDDSVYEVLNASLQAFQKYLKRNKKLPPKRVAPFLSFAKAVKLLMRLRFQRVQNIIIKEKLKTDFSSKNIVSKEWILEKVNEL